MAVLGEAFSGENSGALDPTWSGEGLLLGLKHFETAFAHVSPSVSPQGGHRCFFLEPILFISFLGAWCPCCGPLMMASFSCRCETVRIHAETTERKSLRGEMM
jgi:hypothetical protein